MALIIASPATFVCIFILIILIIIIYSPTCIDLKLNFIRKPVIHGFCGIFIQSKYPVAQNAAPDVNCFRIYDFMVLPKSYPPFEPLGLLIFIQPLLHPQCSAGY